MIGNLGIRGGRVRERGREGGAVSIYGGAVAMVEKVKEKEMAIWGQKGEIWREMVIWSTARTDGDEVEKRSGCGGRGARGRKERGRGISGISTARPRTKIPCAVRDAARGLRRLCCCYVRSRSARRVSLSGGSLLTRGGRGWGVRSDSCGR